MTSVLGKLFGNVDVAVDEPHTKGDVAYHKAVDASEELLYRIREAERETSAARAVTADIWSQAQNIPFMTTVFQAVQEAKTGPETLRDPRFVAIKINGGGRLRHT